MRIGILGSGLMGSKLGTIFARAGHEVIFSYARSINKLKRLARDAGENAHAGTPREAAENADALLLAVHWNQMEDVLAQAGDLSGKVIISCSLPLNAQNTELVVAHTSSGAEALAKKFPKALFISAFHTVPSEVLFDGVENRHKANNPSDVGSLRMARYTEPFANIVAQLAYSGNKGPELAYRFEWLGKQAVG
jgi:predicted dinucleotide-binding enzyme